MSQPFQSVLPLFPASLRTALQSLPPSQQDAVEEIRLRTGLPMGVVLPAGERPLRPDKPLCVQDLEQVMETATQGSVHTALNSTRGGFVTVRGGHRLGLCGAVVSHDGDIATVRHPSSLCLRVARSIPGAADGLLPRIWHGGRPRSTLILSPPGLGKTTLLRDLVRQVSDGGAHGAPCRVSLVDERGEVAGCWLGQPQLPVGAHTDVLDGCAKAKGIIWMLRGMGPQVLAMDEITAPEDVAALQTAVGCGVAVLATAHADGLEDLSRRALYRTLPEIFDRAVLIKLQGRRRVYEVVDLVPHVGRDDPGAP